MIEPNKRAPKTCSRCHTVGHIITSRDCPLRFKETPRQTGRVSDPVPHSNITSNITSRFSSAPVSVGETETIPTAPQVPTRNAIEVNTEANRHAAPAKPTALRYPPFVTPQYSMPIPPKPINKIAPISQIPVIGDPLVHIPPRYDSPEAIYLRYMAARNAWYAAQPAGSIKTNQQYRKAKGLPQRYDKKSYEWCLDFKQISRRCVSVICSREWMKEEIMAYLDWCSTEDKRVEAQVAKDIGDNPLANNRRGMKEIWKSAEKDSRE